MLFLEGATLDLITPSGFDLAEVQRDVFQNITKKWFSTHLEWSDSSSLESDDDSVETAIAGCPCFFKAVVQIAADDVRRYTELLSDLAESAEPVEHPHDDNVNHSKLQRSHELEMLHSRITQGQLMVQKQLLGLTACPHVHLTQECENSIHLRLLHHQYMLASHVLPFYRRSKRTLPIRSTACHLSFLTDTPGQSKLVKLPILGKIGSSENVLSTLATKDDFSLPALIEGWKGPHVDVPEIIIQDSTLYYLFEDPSSHGMHFPFTVTDCDTDCTPLSRHRIHFFGPIWSRPPDARSRARLFYEWGFRTHCLTEMRSSAAICEHPAELSMEQTLLDSRRSSTAVATTPNFSRRLSLRSRKNHDHPSLSISNAKQLPFPQKDARALVDDSGGVSSRRMSLRTRESQESSAVSLDSTQASSIQSLHTTCSSATAHSNNRRQSSRKPAVTTRVGSKDEAEDEEVKLTIDILDSASIGFEESPVSPYATRSTVAACSVVSRRRSSTPTNNTSLVSELMTPVGSTPASPVPEDPASPSGQSTPIFAAASPNSTRVIPLEPVSRTKTHAVTETENVTGLSISDPSERSRYSWSTLQWADVRVHVCYESSLWSSASCMACAESAGRCFLWPSCASRRITSGSAPKLDCDKAVPVFLQVKPEYLGVWGCEVLSPFELAEAWLGSKIRGDADIIRVRVLADTGDIIWVEYQSLQDFLGANPDLKPEINVGQLSSLFTQLSRLPVGSYVLTPSADQTTGPFDLYEADHPVSPEGASHDIVGRLDLNSVVHQFSNVSSNVVQLTSRISSTELLQSPWHSVHRLKLDLNLPACLNSSGVLVEPTGRDLRLPGLPLDRLVLTTENSPATKSSASEQSVRPKSVTPKPINPKTASSTHRKVVRSLSTSVSGKAPPKRKLRSKH